MRLECDEPRRGFGNEGLKSEEVKRAAAERWVAAVNADGQYGQWRYGVAKKPEDVIRILGEG